MSSFSGYVVVTAQKSERRAFTLMDGRCQGPNRLKKVPASGHGTPLSRWHSAT
jgi:hypothetical protein